MSCIFKLGARDVQLLTRPAVPLTEKEVAEKDALVDKGFSDWKRMHFQNFIKGLEKHGRDRLDLVTEEVTDKSETDVRAYAAVFFKRYTELESRYPECWSCERAYWLRAGADNYMKRITSGEAKIKDQQEKITQLHLKIKSYTYPMQELKFQYGQNKGKHYSEEEDRFLLVRMHHHGIDRDDCYELIKRDIGEWPLFRWVYETGGMWLADEQVWLVFEI
jgi:SWI/SNF-related matrix-associated actin-dependent regulator of chromatin subfamily A member 5